MPAGSDSSWTNVSGIPSKELIVKDDAELNVKRGILTSIFKSTASEEPGSPMIASTLPLRGIPFVQLLEPFHVVVGVAVFQFVWVSVAHKERGIKKEKRAVTFISFAM